jgi:hypothetical protein
MSQPAAADMKDKERRTRFAARNMWGNCEAITGHWVGVHVLVGYHVLPTHAATPRPMADCTARCLNFGLSAFKFEWGLPFPNGFLDECERACLD